MSTTGTKPAKANRLSSYRSAVVEDIFTALLQQHIWQTSLERVEVLAARVDDSGYDVVLESGRIIRHVQIKTRDSRSPSRDFKVNSHRSQENVRPHRVHDLRRTYISQGVWPAL